MSRLFFLLTLLPALASAQSLITLRRVGVPTDTTWTFGAASCSETLSIQWTYSPTVAVGQFCSNLKLWATTGECGDAPGAEDKRFEDVEQNRLLLQRTGTFDVKVVDLPGFKTTTEDGGTTLTCGTEGITKTHKICGLIETFVPGGTICQKQVASGLSLIYDTQAPNAPNILSSVAEDAAASFEFSVDTDATEVFAEVQGPTATDFTRSSEVLSSTKLIRVRNLTNAETWKVRLRARDAAGNESLPSDVVEVVPVRTLGFFGVYRDQGGTDTGGCSVGGLALVPFAALAVARALARRSRRS